MRSAASPTITAATSVSSATRAASKRACSSARFCARPSVSPLHLPGEGITHRAEVPARRPVETARQVEYGTALGIVTATRDGGLFGVFAGERFVTGEEGGAAQHTRRAERQNRSQTASISDAACGDNRYVLRNIDNRRNER